MNKEALLELLFNTLPDNAIFDLPVFEVEKVGDIVGLEYRGFDHHGFTVTNPIKNSKGRFEITYSR